MAIRSWKDVKSQSKPTSKIRSARDVLGTLSASGKAAQENKQYADAMKASREMEVKTPSDKAADKRARAAVFGATDKLKSYKPEAKETPPTRLEKPKTAVTKWVDIKRNLEKSTANSTQKVMADRAAVYDKEPPIIRDIHKGLDKFSNLKPVELIGDLGQEFYTPGGTVSASVNAAKGLGALISKASPTLGLSGKLLPTVGREAIKEGVVGAQLGAGNVLAKDPEASGKEILQGAELGGAGGVVGGVLAPVIGRGVRSVAEVLRREKAPAKVVEEIPVAAATEQVQPLQPSPLTAPTREVAPNRPTVPGERRFINTLEQSGRLTPDTEQLLKQSTERKYDPITNAETLTRANERINQGVDKVVGDLLGKETGYTADDVVTGIRAIDELQKAGNHEQAVTVAEQLSKKLTEAGRAVQAASVVNRLSPDGQFIYLVRQAQKTGKTVTPADAAVYRELAQTVQEGATSKQETSDFLGILNKLKSGEKISTEELSQAQSVLDDAQKYFKPKNETPIAPELSDVRKRDKVLTYLEKQAADARAQWNAKRNIGFAQKVTEPDIVLLAKMATYEVAKGAVKLVDFSEYVAKEFGEFVRPYAEEIYNRASKIVGSTAKHISEDKFDKANEVFRRMSGQDTAEKEVVKKMSETVKKLITDVKNNTVDANDLAAIREFSEEISKFKGSKRVISEDEKFLQSVKSLAKKLSDVDTKKITPSEANREVSSLLRQVTQLADGKKLPTAKIDNESMKNLAYDLMEVERPQPKPKTIHEKVAEKFIKEGNIKPGDVEKLRALAKQLNDIKGSDAQKADMKMQEILNKYQKASTWDRIQTIRYIAMLLNSSTQAVNAVSGPIMASTGYVADIFGTMVDIALNKVLKRPRTTTLYGSNPLRFLAGWFKNAGVGAKAGAKGVNPGGITSQHDIRGLTYKSLYNPLGLAERGLGAISKGADYGTYKSVFDSELKKQAFLDAKNKKIRGRDAVKSHMEKFLIDPPIEAIDQADKIGKDTTFQRTDSTGGSIANFLSNPKGKAKVIKPVVGSVLPFIKTPINIASSAVRMTPPGAVIKGIMQLADRSETTQREALRTLSLGLTGTGISALGFYLSKLGVITGANDSGNKNVDSLKEQVGQGKYRFNTSGLQRYVTAMLNGEGPQKAEQAAKYQEGDRQFDYNRLQPLAFPLAIGAGLEKSGASKAAEDAFGSLYGMSTLKGVQDVFGTSFEGTYGQKAMAPFITIAESFAKSFSPSMLAQEARRQDTTQRKTEYKQGFVPDVKTYFQSRTPGQTDKLPPMITALGDTKSYTPGVKGQYANPFKSEKAPFNKAAKVVSDLYDRVKNDKLAPTPPEKTVEGKNANGESVKFTIKPQRYAQMQQEQGAEISKRILNLSPSMSDADKAEAILQIYEEVRAEQRNKVKQELGIIVR